MQIYLHTYSKSRNFAAGSCKAYILTKLWHDLLEKNRSCMARMHFASFKGRNKLYFDMMEIE